MKAILEFDLRDDGDRYLHREAMAAPELVAALRALDQRLRTLIKYGDNLSDETRAILQEVRNLVPHEVLDGLSDA